MKPILSALIAMMITVLALLAVNTAKACEEHRRKPVECTSNTSSVTGTTRTVCR